jgi:hypothetical protein
MQNWLQVAASAELPVQCAFYAMPCAEHHEFGTLWPIGTPAAFYEA